MPTLSFRVDGYPAPYSSTTTRPWRNAIAAKAQVLDEVIPSETLFTVSIVFEMADPIRSDIDSLAKPVADTLFVAKSNVPNENVTNGIIWPPRPTNAFLGNFQFGFSRLHLSVCVNDWPR